MSLQVFHDPSPSFLVTTYYLDFPKLKNGLIKNSHFLLCPTTHSGAPNHSYSLVPRPSAKQAPSASPFIHSFIHSHYTNLSFPITAVLIANPWTWCTNFNVWSVKKLVTVLTESSNIYILSGFSTQCSSLQKCQVSLLFSLFNHFFSYFNFPDFPFSLLNYFIREFS